MTKAPDVVISCPACPTRHQASSGSQSFNLIAKHMKGKDIAALVGMSTGPVTFIQAGRLFAERAEAEAMALGRVASNVAMSAQRAS